MNNTLCYTLGRIIYAIPFIIFGLNHLMMADSMAMMVPSFMPAAVFWVYLTGVALLLCGLLILANRYVKWACYCLIIFMAVVILSVHVPSILAGANMPMPLISMLKDLGLIGGALILSSYEK